MYFARNFFTTCRSCFSLRSNFFVVPKSEYEISTKSMRYLKFPCKVYLNYPSWP